MRGGGGGGGGDCDALHRVRETPLPEVDLEAEYSVARVLSEGRFSRVLLATHRRSATTLALKALHAAEAAPGDFRREFHYSYRMSAHPAVVSVYPVAFRSGGRLVFALEHAPLGDLGAAVQRGGVGEAASKRVAEQLAAALDFLHSKELVHRDVTPDNVLVFAADLRKVKLADFGAARRDGALVSRARGAWPPLQPPEVCEVVSNERYHCRAANDVWQLAVLLLVCLAGAAAPPWQAADALADPDYAAFSRWQRRRSTKLPPHFRRFSARLLRLFRRLLEHKPDKRAPASEVAKYLKDAWLLGGSAGAVASPSGANSGYQNATNTTSTSGFRRHCDDVADEGKSRLRKLLSSYGIETTVDQKLMSRRVWEWVMSCETHSVEAASLEGV